ncbi:MAG: zinc-ribbon domain-containing protein [Blastocatellia bacterium]
MSQNIMPVKRAEVHWEWIGEAWKLFTNNPGAWIGMTLTTAIITIVLIVLPIAFILVPMGIFASTSSPDSALATAGFALLLIPLFLIVMLVVAAYLSSGMYRAAIRQARGETISVGDLFSGGDCFLRVLGLMVLLGITQFVIAFIFSVPGMIVEALQPLGSTAANIPILIISGFIFFAIPLIVDRKAGVFEAISASIEATKSQWWMFAIFAFVLGLLFSIGAIVCGVGLLVTVPLYFTTAAIAYRDTFGLPGARNYDAFSTPPPPPDYRTYMQSQTPAQEAPAQPWSAPAYSAPAPAPQSQPPQPESRAANCPHCGATLARVMNFCNQCGRPLRNA